MMMDSRFSFTFPLIILNHNLYLSASYVIHEDWIQTDKVIIMIIKVEEEGPVIPSCIKNYGTA